MAEQDIRRVGIVGLGKMGRPMARHLKNKGFDVVGCELNKERRSEAESEGIRVVASARELAGASDFVIVVVGFDSEAEAVLLGPDGIVAGARPGLIVGIASTVAPRTMQRLAAQTAHSGLKLIDMPITRGEPAAEAGNLLVMAGGPVDVFEICKPALSAFATSIFHVGELGAGQVAKMVNNLILWSCISANEEGFSSRKDSVSTRNACERRCCRAAPAIGPCRPARKSNRCPGPKRTCASFCTKPTACGSACRYAGWSPRR